MSYQSYLCTLPPRSCLLPLLHPAQSPLLWCFMLDSFLAPFQLHGARWDSAIVWGAFFGLQRPASDGLTIFLLHRGAGVRATRHAIAGGALLGLVSGTLAGASFAVDNVALGLALDMAWELGFMVRCSRRCACVLVCLNLTLALGAPRNLKVAYALLAFLPRRCIYRRPAVRPYAIFWVVVRAMMVLANILRSVGLESSGLRIQAIVLIGM